MSNKITYVIIDTDLPTLSKSALDISVKNFEPQDVLIYTDQPHLWSGYSTREVDKFRSINDYNNVILNKLPHDLTTDFSIIIQYDGFVINPEKFSSLYYEYDYIGAPWPEYKNYNVGNGGFNWRSKRIIQAIAQYTHLKHDDEAEDVFIARLIRCILETRHGVKFASCDLASHFSVESKMTTWKTFGFHGVMHLPIVYQKNLDFLFNNLSPRLIEKRGYLIERGLRSLPIDLGQKYIEILNQRRNS